jgi:serine-type D-Ala-D-Ala carboxypeptidase (penicillin-binding protein 5/6)
VVDATQVGAGPIPPARRARRRAGYQAGGLTVALALAAITLLPAAPSFAKIATFPGGASLASLAASADRPAVTVRGGELVDLGSGAVLWDKDSNIRRPMGSITKVMTALLVLQAGELNRKIRVSEAAIRYVEKDGASSAGLILGDVLTTRQLLEAMLIPSGCDAAFLLATAYGPGRTAFIAKMNAEAKALGMSGTHFTSFDGMPYPTEYSTYSTPADLIKLGEQAMRYKLFRQIVAQRRYVLPAGPGHHGYKWQNTDKLIGSYRGALGIKTGDTDKAGNCLLFEARRGRLTLIGVVLHADPNSNPTSAIAAARVVLNWGFGHS